MLASVRHPPNFVICFVFGTKTADRSVSVHFRFGPGFDDFVSVPFLAETKVAFLAQSETERGFDY